MVSPTVAGSDPLETLRLFRTKELHIWRSTNSAPGFYLLSYTPLCGNNQSL